MGAILRREPLVPCDSTLRKLLTGIAPAEKFSLLSETFQVAVHARGTLISVFRDKSNLPNMMSVPSRTSTSNSSLRTRNYEALTAEDVSCRITLMWMSIPDHRPRINASQRKYIPAVNHSTPRNE